MSTQKNNKEIVAKYFAEYWGRRNPSSVDELCADDFIISYPAHGPKYGKQAAKQMLIDFKTIFPDLASESQSHGEYGLVADGDIVVATWVGGGTHTGSPFDVLVVGGPGQKNTGKHIRFSGITIFTLKDGKILRRSAITRFRSRQAKLDKTIIGWHGLKQRISRNLTRQTLF